MKKTVIRVAICTALALSLAQPALAGLGDVLKDLKESGEQILQKSSSVESPSAASGLSTETLIEGLKEALAVGSETAIKALSAEGGYLNNAKLRVPLPQGIQQVSGLLKKYGLESQVEEFEKSMNHAAEQAVPQASALISAALKEMTIEDAEKIYKGADNAATEYFREKTSAKLSELFKPSIEKSMGDVGVTSYYNLLVEQAKAYPMVGSMLGGNLEDHVTEKALDGLFVALAEQEKLIRENPVARTTDILKTVFK